MPELKHTEEAVYVYGPWIRIWHWVQMFAILALGITRLLKKSRSWTGFSSDGAA